MTSKDGLSYEVAQLIMRVVNWLLGLVGLDGNQTLITIFYAGVVLVVSMVIGYFTKWIVFALSREIAKRWSSDMYHSLVEQSFFHKVCRMIPALVFLILIEVTLSSHDTLSSWLTKLTLIYVVYVTSTALCALIMAVWQHIDRQENKRKLPLKGLAQLAKGIVWIVALIFIVAIIVSKSPGALLAGLGAFAAVLMLVF